MYLTVPVIWYCLTGWRPNSILTILTTVATYATRDLALEGNFHSSLSTTVSTRSLPLIHPARHVVPPVRRDSCLTVTASSLNGTRGQQIASVNLQGQDPQHLTESGGVNAWPAVSPDGKRVVFSSSRDGAFNLYLMDVDGHNVLRLTNSPTSDIHASWSPSGKHIAFTSLRDGNYEIYVLQADGLNLNRVTQHPERDDFSVWHPDGKHLLTVAERKGKFDLYLSRLEEALTSGGNSQ